MAAQYGLALAYMRAEENEKAKEIVINQLLSQDPSNLFYLDAATDIYIALGEPLKAVELLQPHVSLNPRNQVLALNQANALISASQYEQAIDLLRDFLLVNKDYQIAYQLMTEAYQKAKQFSQMHQSKAEVYALYGAYTRAVDELQYAYNFAGEDHLEKQRIRARIKQFRDQEERLERL